MKNKHALSLTVSAPLWRAGTNNGCGGKKQNGRPMNTTRKLFSSLILALGLFLICGAKAVTLSDDFNDGVLNTNLWTAYTYPWASSVTETSGLVRLVNGAGIITASHFSTCNIRGRFRMTASNYDRTKVIVRSDGITFDPNWRTIASGILIQFTATSNPDYGTTNVVVYNINTSTAIARTAVPISMGQYYDFLIRDLGSELQVFFGRPNRCFAHCFDNQ